MKRKKKTHKAAAKRLKVNAAGKIFRMRACRLYCGRFFVSLCW